MQRVFENVSWAQVNGEKAKRNIVVSGSRDHMGRYGINGTRYNLVLLVKLGKPLQ